MKKILLFILVSALGFQVSATELYGLKIGATEQALHSILPTHPQKRLERPKRDLSIIYFSREDSLALSHGESDDISVSFCNGQLCNIISNFAIDIFSNDRPQYDKYLPIFNRKYTWLSHEELIKGYGFSDYYKSDDSIIELSGISIAIIQKGHEKQINYDLPPDLESHI